MTRRRVIAVLLLAVLLLMIIATAVGGNRVLEDLAFFLLAIGISADIAWPARAPRTGKATLPDKVPAPMITVKITGDSAESEHLFLEWLKREMRKDG